VNPTQVQFAGFWRRLGAGLIDIGLVLTLTAPLLYLIYGPAYFSWFIEDFALFNFYDLWEALLTRALPLVALITFWTRAGATPGKRLMHCKIVDARTHQLPSIRQAITRCVCYAVSSLPLNLGFFWIGWDKRKQGFHDKLAKTVVLYAPDDYGQQSLWKLMREAS